MEKHTKTHLFYGMTTMGEKGQTVIPVKAREAMGMKKGEQLLVFGMTKDLLVLSKFSNLERIAVHLENKLKGIRKIIHKRTK